MAQGRPEIEQNPGCSLFHRSAWQLLRVCRARDACLVLASPPDSAEQNLVEPEPQRLAPRNPGGASRAAGEPARAPVHRRIGRHATGQVYGESSRGRAVVGPAGLGGGDRDRLRQPLPGVRQRPDGSGRGRRLVAAGPRLGRIGGAVVGPRTARGKRRPAAPGLRGRRPRGLARGGRRPSARVHGEPQEPVRRGGPARDPGLAGALPDQAQPVPGTRFRLGTQGGGLRAGGPRRSQPRRGDVRRRRQAPGLERLAGRVPRGDAEFRATDEALSARRLPAGSQGAGAGRSGGHPGARGASGARESWPCVRPPWTCGSAR